MTKPLEGIRILDFTWLNAGAKGTRHLANMGAEIIRLEWKDKLDFTRVGFPFHRREDEERLSQSRVFDRSLVPSVNRAAGFNDVNAGKLGASINMRHPKGKDLFRRLLPIADVVADNYTANTLVNWGFSWEQMAEHKPDIIYVQAPGFGFTGPYRDYRSYGPIAAGVSGLQYMAGMADKPPVGYGFSYLDVGGPWYICMAVLSALHFRSKTGRGQHIDLSQVGPGMLMTGTAILDFTANGRHYARSGNRGPYTSSAPHGAYRCQGEDRWVAIAVSTDEEWDAFCGVLDQPAWTKDPRFVTRLGRLDNQDDLDHHVEAWTIDRDPYEVMHALQKAGVPAGVCQNVENRVESDEQLGHWGYVETVEHSEYGPYRVEGIVGHWSETQPRSGSVHGWGAPCYGEHNDYVFKDVLGISDAEMEALVEENVIGWEA